jgi:hypothetical protein
MKTVVMVGCHSTFPGPKTQDMEVWCINRAFLNQESCDRVYMMDDLENFWKNEHRKAEFLEMMNSASWRVILREHRDEIPRSERFPIEDLLTRLPYPFFTCTLAYMVAQAIRERFEKIVMHRIYVLPQSTEYFEQLPCLDFWLGIAIGQGIKVDVSQDSDLLRTFPWQPRMYGYSKHVQSPISIDLSQVVEDHNHDPVVYGMEPSSICDLANAAKGIARYEVHRPINWRTQPSFTRPLGYHEEK